MRLVKNFDEHFVSRVQLPVPTASYSPLAHNWIIDTLREEGDKQNLSLTNLNIIGNNLGTKIIGTFDVMAGNDTYGMRVAFKNSYDKSMPFAMALGAVIFVCSNSVISGEINYKRKHTGIAMTDSKKYITEGLSFIGDYYERLVTDMNLLSGISLTEKEASHITGELYLLGDVINGMQLNIVKDELYNSKNFVHIDSELFSAFDWYQSITESLKKSHPTRFISDHAELHQFVKNRFL